MKEKTRRVGSFLCFGPPATDDDEKNDKPAMDSPEPEADEGKKKRSRRLMSKIVKSISFKSNPSNRGAKLMKERVCWELGKEADSSENKPSAFKNSDGANFSATSAPVPCLGCSAAAPPTATAPAPRVRVRTKETFMPPPANRNGGRATGLSLSFVLLSVFAMVFCGRLYAVLCTATWLWLWLFLWPRRRARRVPPEFAYMAAAAAASKVVGSGSGSRRRAEKQRVMMDGFLPRNRK